MDVLEQLETYLSFMDQLGVDGLALEETPFGRPLPPPIPMRPSSTAPMPRGSKPPPRPQGLNPPPAQEKKRSAPPKSSFDLLSIMQTVDNLGTATEDTRAKAEAINGKDATSLLQNLYAGFQDCQACALGTTRRCFVFGEGLADAKVMFVGEFPSSIDDQTGRPFMDAAGELLTKIIEAMKLNRAECFLTNAVKCAPPNGRPSLPDELNACAPILKRQIDAVQPQVIVALGPQALRFFRGDQVSLMRVRGQFFDWQGIKVIPTFHPSYVLRNPRAKREVWEDMKRVMATLSKT